MRRENKSLALALSTLAALALLPMVALAQDEVGPRPIRVPNSMEAHTWFIVAAVGAFLAWCISYVLQFRRNQAARGDKEKREALLREKDNLLGQIAELEAQKEAGAIPEPRYEKEFRKARGRLSEVLARLRGRDAVED
jgi:hypothetical protein